MIHRRRFAAVAAVLAFAGAVLVLAPSLAAQARPAPAPGQAQGTPPPPPEVKEWMAAQRIADPAARLKEMERIRDAYPKSPFQARFAAAILQTRFLAASDVDTVVALQKDALKKSTGQRRVFDLFSASMNVLRHPNFAKFDKAKATAAVVKFCEEGRELSKTPAFAESVPADQRAFIASNAANLLLPEVMAWLAQGDTARAANGMGRFAAEGGKASAFSEFLNGGALEGQGKTKEAYAAYFKAALDGYPEAEEKARSAWARTHGGSADGFAKELEAAQRTLPYKPEPPQPARGGRTVVAELFTGSECPPCVAADLGFDGLLETFPPRDLAVLEYHIHIPRPDPMGNESTLLRAQSYAVESTPSTFFDGEAAAPGGGSREDAATKYGQYAAEVRKRLTGPASPALSAKAVLRGDKVTVDFAPGAPPKDADYHLALVQKEERFRGANGIVFHKMIVRHVVTLDAAALKAKRAVLDLAAIDTATASYIADYEKTVGGSFAERHDKIDWAKLRIVLMVQERATRKILNAAVADVVPAP